MTTEGITVQITSDKEGVESTEESSETVKCRRKDFVREETEGVLT